MPNVINTIKEKMSGSKDPSNKRNAGTGDTEEPAFSIQPHPAKTNDPADLQPHGGLRNNDTAGAFHARDPYVPPEHIRNNMPEPESHEALQARIAELNK
ncbi:hypothetical protein BDQ12DRAFT_685799 [Crucibulum laeve]|uniref:Uncharacterized protein n=1 Tax=Crucibulum laeve TaxID=68775 RepID=A0A5C3LWA7_9AGAR|nr:hypothetical protein BDQ12DRAFT_685799 [Crucibulum laeve]